MSPTSALPKYEQLCLEAGAVAQAQIVCLYRSTFFSKMPGKKKKEKKKKGKGRDGVCNVRKYYTDVKRICGV